jgi:hypothetical protein
MDSMEASCLLSIRSTLVGLDLAPAAPCFSDALTFSMPLSSAALDSKARSLPFDAPLFKPTSGLAAAH